MALARVRCVVFDVDDTLYLERDYVHSGFLAVGKRVRETLAVPGFFDAAWRRFESGDRGDLFNRALTDIGVSDTPELIDELVRCYRTHEPRIGLLPDARRALEQLYGDITLGAITDGPVPSQRAKVRALGVRAWTDALVITGELGEGFGKPHPRAYELVEDQTGVPARACAYVADNPHKDFVAPHRRGWATVRIRRPGGLHVDAPSGNDVELEVTCLDELLAAMGRA